MKKVILLLLLGAWVFTSVAQEKVFQVNEVSVINYGDGRLLFRELTRKKHRYRANTASSTAIIRNISWLLSRMACTTAVSPFQEECSCGGKHIQGWMERRLS